MFVTSRLRSDRKGATAVELAFVLPVFVMLLFALVEFGHAMMVRSLMLATAKEAARLGAIEGTTCQDLVDFINTKLDRAIDASVATIYIKDFKLVDQTGAQTTDVADLPNIVLEDAETRDPFIVHIRVPYEEVALLPPFWVTGLQITADSVVRHE